MLQRTLSTSPPSFFLLVSVLALSAWQSTAFTVHTPSLTFAHRALLAPSVGAKSTFTLLQAKKKRRRKDSASEEDDDGSGLPDFDLNDGEDDDAVVTKTSSSSRSSTSGGLDEISANMMGSSRSPKGSVKDLINDRSLESRFEFEQNSAVEQLPDLAELAASKRSGNSVGETVTSGSKRARQEARRTAAQALEPAEDEKNWYENIPFLKDAIQDESGKVTPVKLLEFGTWTGIYSLVAWEVYLNSPLFHRAAPMVPVVYDLLL